MLFAVIAMVALTVSANAANEVVLTDTACDEIWDLSYTYHRGKGKSVTDSKAAADNAKKNCEDGSGTNGPVTGPEPNVISPR